MGGSANYSDTVSDISGEEGTRNTEADLFQSMEEDVKQIGEEIIRGTQVVTGRSKYE